MRVWIFTCMCVGACVCVRVCFDLVPFSSVLPGMREHPPISTGDLAEHIERLKANDGLRFSQEYEVNFVLAAGGALVWPRGVVMETRPRALPLAGAAGVCVLF